MGMLSTVTSLPCCGGATNTGVCLIHCAEAVTKYVKHFGHNFSTSSEGWEIDELESIPCRRVCVFERFWGDTNDVRWGVAGVILILPIIHLCLCVVGVGTTHVIKTNLLSLITVVYDVEFDACERELTCRYCNVDHCLTVYAIVVGSETQAGLERGVVVGIVWQILPRIARVFR